MQKTLNQGFYVEKGDGEDENIDARGPVAYVTGSPADVEHLSRKIMEYRQFLNLYILLLDEVYRRAEPDKYEENFLRNEEYFARKDDKYVKRSFNRQEYSSENMAENKVALKYLSSPTVVRALFQKENMGANEKRKQTRLDNLRKQNPHLQAIVKTGMSDKRAADLVTSILKDKKFFGDMMAAGANLKSHVIRNAVKTIKTARANAFENLKTTGRLHLPRAEKLDRCSNFFVDLCEVSSSKKGNHIKVNLDRNSRTVTLSLDIARKEQGLSSAKVTKIGLINGRLAVCLLYKKPKREVEPKEEKLAALDLGLKYLASIFIMDDASPSLCIKNQHLIQYNARFNEFNSKINEELTPLNQALARLRKQEKGYVLHEEMIKTSADYAKMTVLRDRTKKKQQKVLRERKDFVNDQMHKAAVRVLEYLESRGVTTLTVSRNLGEMKNSGTTKGTPDHKRRFATLPLIRFIDYLELNAWQYDLKIVEVDEGWTSKANCFQDDVRAIRDASAEHRKKIGLIKKESANKKHIETGTAVETAVVPKFSLPSGTSLSGSRIKGKDKERGSKAYWHADINGAVNHLRVGGTEIKWTKSMRAKVFSPIVVNLKTSWIKNRVDKKDAKAKLRNIIDSKNGIASYLSSEYGVLPTLRSGSVDDSTIHVGVTGEFGRTLSDQV